MGWLRRSALAAVILASCVVLGRESPAAPISTAPKPPPTAAPKLPSEEQKIACTPIPPISRYTFDDVLTDATGKNPAFAPPANAPAPTFSAGRFGKAVSLANGVVVRATLGTLPPPWTMSVWVRQTSATKPENTSGCGPFGYDSIVTAYNEFWIQTKTVRASCTPTSPQAESLLIGNVPAAAKIGAWTHIGVVFDGTVSRAYQDGKALGTGAPDTKSDMSKPSTWSLGQRFDVPTKYSFVGDLDELRIYAGALTPLQVLRLFEGNEPTNCDRR